MQLDLPSFSSAGILVAGDVMLDHYLWSEVTRISPEAPVPIVKIMSKSSVPGGAANVAANLRGLGCRVTLLGVRGRDESGRLLSNKLSDIGVETFLLDDDSRFTTTKTRVMAQRQQLIRLDEERTEPLSAEISRELFAAFASSLPGAQAVVLSDYGKGMLSGDLSQKLIAVSRKQDIPVLVDPKGSDWERYRGATCITPNETELGLVADGRICSEEDLLHVAAGVRRRYDLQFLLVTRGPKGMVLLGPDSDPILIPAKRRELFDVSGAGDTVIAALAAGIGAGLPWHKAATVANVAAGVVVGKVGTHPISLDQLHMALRLSEEGSFHKLFNLADASVQMSSWRAAGERIVFTNGCFDLLHSGHIKLLHAAAQEGSKLVVGLNSDSSVRRLKGPARPILEQEERASILAALECVDMVVIFEEETPLNLIRSLRPDVLVKGSDYSRETVVGYELVESWGGKVVLVPLAEGLSTTNIVRSIRKK